MLTSVNVSATQYMDIDIFDIFNLYTAAVKDFWPISGRPGGPVIHKENLVSNESIYL